MPKSHGFDFQHCIHTMKYQCCFSSAKFPSSPSPHQLLTQQSQASKMEQTSPPIFQNVLPEIDDKNHSQQRILQEKKNTTISKEYQNNVWTPASVNLLRNQRMNSSKKKFLHISSSSYPRIHPPFPFLFLYLSPSTSALLSASHFSNGGQTVLLLTLL